MSEWHFFQYNIQCLDFDGDAALGGYFGDRVDCEESNFFAASFNSFVCPNVDIVEIEFFSLLSKNIILAMEFSESSDM
jgi:hypothetical protein